MSASRLLCFLVYFCMLSSVDSALYLNVKITIKYKLACFLLHILETPPTKLKKN